MAWEVLADAPNSVPWYKDLILVSLGLLGSLISVWLGQYWSHKRERSLERNRALRELLGRLTGLTFETGSLEFADCAESIELSYYDRLIALSRGDDQVRYRSAMEKHRDRKSNVQLRLAKCQSQLLRAMGETQALFPRRKAIVGTLEKACLFVRGFRNDGAQFGLPKCTGETPELADRWWDDQFARLRKFINDEFRQKMDVLISALRDEV